MLGFDGSLESINHAYHVVNQGVLHHAPCSVAILVDRGFGGSAQVSAKDVTYSIRLLFFGGCDDRETLAYASRMAEHPGISLTVTHFRVSNSPSVPQSSEDKTADNMAIEAFKAMADGENMDYQETVVNGHVELAAAIRAMGKGTDLFLVGRSPLMPEVLSEIQGCPELGVVGGYLTSEEFTAAASVLVIQCYDPIRDPYTKLYSVEGEASVTAITCHDIEAALN